MDQATKHSVSVAIRHPQRPHAVLLVQRPLDDEDLPGVWGLPAASLLPGEAWEDAVRRAGAEKLGVNLAVGAVLREGARQRPAYTLQMRLYEARIIAGEPAVPQKYRGVTQYRAWRWGSADDLRAAAERGSLCSILYRSLDAPARE